MLKRPMTNEELVTALSKAENTIACLKGELTKYKDKFHKTIKTNTKVRNKCSKNKDLIHKLKYELSHIPVRTIVVVDEKEMSWEGPQKFYPKQSVDNAINRVFNDTKAF